MPSKKESLKLTITDREKARLVKVVLQEMGLKETAPGIWEKVPTAKKPKTDKKSVTSKAEKKGAVTAKPARGKATGPKPEPRPKEPVRRASAAKPAVKRPSASKPGTTKRRK